MNNIKKYSLAIIAATGIFTTQAVFADQLDNIKKRGTLICGTLGTSEPFSFADQATREIKGYDVDFCRAIADSLGVKTELKLLAVEARIPELSQGRVDIVIANLGYTPQRAEQIEYSHQYFVSQQKIMTRTADGYKSINDLGGKQVSAPKGSTSETAVIKKVPTAKVVTFQDPPTAFMALVQNKVDAFALSELTLIKFKDQVADKVKMTILPESMMAEAWGVGVKKGEVSLLKAVNEKLSAMEKNGDAINIFKKWLGSDSPYKAPREFVIAPIQG
jgi:polar amino acid transport system substrate-binding protein